MTALPSWLSEDLWKEFLRMRKSIKKPPTDFAQFLVLKTLYDLKAAGHDPVACLEQSIVNSWADVYELKAKKATRQAVTDYTQNQAKLQADSIEARQLTREQIAENARKAREKFHRPRPQGELLQ